MLIAQMQKNADVVEKNILRSEQLLAEVRRYTKASLNCCFLKKKINHRPSPQLLPPGWRKWPQWRNFEAPEWALWHSGWSRKPAEEPLLGCGHSQEAQTPAGQRDRERVSCSRQQPRESGGDVSKFSVARWYFGSLYRRVVLFHLVYDNPWFSGLIFKRLIYTHM